MVGLPSGESPPPQASHVLLGDHTQLYQNDGDAGTVTDEVAVDDGCHTISL